MRVIRSNIASVCRDERGYTLPEILTAVSIMGIILAIGIIVLLALLERWRVEAAADLRLAHTRATEQLTDWRVVFMPDGTPLRTRRLEGGFQGYRGGAMQDLGYELPRIHILRGWVNRRKECRGPHLGSPA
jgi:prepilin-type N-terminal cleavage/methylation domain-containing protein